MAEYIKNSTILCTDYDPGIVFDLLVLIDDDLFRYEYAHLYSENHVIDDHEHEPPMFSKVRPYSWIRRDFQKRFVIALWMYHRAIVIQKEGTIFDDIVLEAEKKFTQDLYDIIKLKYIEFRSDRHVLRACLQMNDPLAIDLLKANVAKLALELCYLIEGKPYPYRARLALEIANDTLSGRDFYKISNNLLANKIPEEIIGITDLLVGRIIDMLLAKKMFPDDFLTSWWKYLD